MLRHPEVHRYSCTFNAACIMLQYSIGILASVRPF
jgi:hypothetical protein